MKFFGQGVSVYAHAHKCVGKETHGMDKSTAGATSKDEAGEAVTLECAASVML